MSQPFNIVAHARNEHGKGSARRSRRAGQIPGVIYAGGKDAVSITVDPKELTRALLSPLRRNTLFALELKVDGQTKSTHHVMFKAAQIDPVRRDPIHIDFLEIDPSKEVLAKVPLDVIGRPKAVIMGGKMQVTVRTVNIRALPSNIPEKLTWDVTAAAAGVLRAKDLPLPEGVTVTDSAELPLVSLRMPKGDKAADDAAAKPAKKK